MDTPVIQKRLLAFERWMASFIDLVTSLEAVLFRDVYNMISGGKFS
jgi:hypothetical protein